MGRKSSGRSKQTRCVLKNNKLIRLPGDYECLEDYDITFIAIDDNIDTSKPGGKTLVTIMAAVVEFEKDNIREQFLAAKMEKMKNYIQLLNQIWIMEKR